jgi:hypothetical protein
MKSPPKTKRGPAKTALQTDSKLARYYRARRSFQASINKRSRRGHNDRRQCVCCGTRVSNRNLGGYCGRSAMTGPLYCFRCADWLPQLLLNFGRPER